MKEELIELREKRHSKCQNVNSTELSARELGSRCFKNMKMSDSLASIEDSNGRIDAPEYLQGNTDGDNHLAMELDLSCSSTLSFYTVSMPILVDVPLIYPGKNLELPSLRPLTIVESGPGFCLLISIFELYFDRTYTTILYCFRRTAPWYFRAGGSITKFGRPDDHILRRKNSCILCLAFKTSSLFFCASQLHLLQR